VKRAGQPSCSSSCGHVNVDVRAAAQHENIPARLCRAAPAAVVAVLVGAACYEASVALRLLDVGPQPGQGPPSGGVVLVLALAALVAGAALVAAAPRHPLAWLLAPAAAALVVARFFSFDPYYAPTLRRMSDGGAVSPAWVAFVAAAALAAGVALRTGRRSGAFLSAAVLVLSFATAVFEGAGH
jgi:hypothetical protein